MMEKRILGRTGLEVGVVGLGVEHITQTHENVDEIFDVAVNGGVQYFDMFTDPLEWMPRVWEVMGPAIKRHRDRLVLALHWGFIFGEPLDQCKHHFDLALDDVGNTHKYPNNQRGKCPSPITSSARQSLRA